MGKKMSRRWLALSSAVAGTSLFAAAGRAAVDTFNGVTSNNWDVNTNWTPNTVPNTTADTAIFDNTGTARAFVELNSSKTIGTLSFANTAGSGYTIGTTNATNLSLGFTTLNHTSTKTNTITAQVLQNGAGTWNVGAGNLVLSNTNGSLANNLSGATINVAGGATFTAVGAGSGVSNSANNAQINLNGGTFVAQGATTTTPGALRETYYNLAGNYQGAGNLSPISSGNGILTRTPNVTQSLTTALQFDQATLTSRSGGLVNQFAGGYVGKITFTNAGAYSFGTRSDDGSILYLDLNNNGSFDDAGELIVDNNRDQGATNATGNVTVAAGTYGIAVGFYQNGGQYEMTARYAAGSGVAYDSQTVINPSAPIAGTAFSAVVSGAGDFTSNTISAGASSTVNVQATSALFGNVSVSNNAAVTFTGNAAALQGSVTGSGSVTFSNSGASSLSAGPAYSITGTTTLNSASVTSARAVTSTAGVTLNGTSTFITNSPLTANAVNVNGTGIFTTTAAVTTGAVNVNGGAYNGNANNALGTGSVTVATSALLNSTGTGNALSGAFTINGTARVNVNSASNAFSTPTLAVNATGLLEITPGGGTTTIAAAAANNNGQILVHAGVANFGNTIINTGNGTTALIPITAISEGYFRPATVNTANFDGNSGDPYIVFENGTNGGTTFLTANPASTRSNTGENLSFNETQLLTRSGLQSTGAGQELGAAFQTSLTIGGATGIAAGVVSFGLNSDDGSSLYVDINNDNKFTANERIVSDLGGHAAQQATGTVSLSAGTYNLAVGYYNGGGPGVIEARVAAGVVTNYFSQTILKPGGVLSAGSTVSIDGAGTLKAGGVNTGLLNLNTSNSGSATLNIVSQAAPTTSNIDSVVLTGTAGVGVVQVDANGVLNVNTLSNPAGGTFTKTGVGSMVLGGNALSGGVVNVNGGKLNLNGSSSPPQAATTAFVAVNSSGDASNPSTLGGTGSVNAGTNAGSFVRINAGGVINPGNATATGTNTVISKGILTLTTDFAAGGTTGATPISFVSSANTASFPAASVATIVAEVGGFHSIGSQFLNALNMTVTAATPGLDNDQIRVAPIFGDVDTARQTFINIGDAGFVGGARLTSPNYVNLQIRLDPSSLRPGTAYVLLDNASNGDTVGVRILDASGNAVYLSEDPFSSARSTIGPNLTDPFFLRATDNSLVQVQLTYDQAFGDVNARPNDLILIVNTPEPASLSLLGLGAAGLLARRRPRRAAGRTRA